MESVKIVELLVKLAEYPSQLLIVGGAALSIFVIKKNSKLLDEIISVNQAYILDLKKSKDEVKDEFVRLTASINDLRVTTNNSIQSLQIEYARISNQIESLCSRVDNAVDGTQNLNTEVKETYGKIILLTQELDGVKKEIKDKHEWTVKSLYKTAKLIKNK